MFSINLRHHKYMYMSFHFSNGNNCKTCIFLCFFVGVWQISLIPHAHPNWNSPLDLLGLTVVIIHDGDRLLVAGLVHVLAHVRPVQPKSLGVGVAAGQEFEGHPAEADLGLLEETLTPRGEFVQLGQDEAGFPVGADERDHQCVTAITTPTHVLQGGETLSNVKPVNPKYIHDKWPNVVVMCTQISYWFFNSYSQYSPIFEVNWQHMHWAL